MLHGWFLQVSCASSLNYCLRPSCVSCSVEHLTTAAIHAFTKLRLSINPCNSPGSSKLITLSTRSLSTSCIAHSFRRSSSDSSLHSPSWPKQFYLRVYSDSTSLTLILLNFSQSISLDDLHQGISYYPVFPLFGSNASQALSISYFSVTAWSH